MNRLYEAATRAAERRDQIEMQSIDRLLAPLAPERAPRKAATLTRFSPQTGFRVILWVSNS